MANTFIFGTATASYQVEGAVDEDGRTPCIWDTFAATPGKTFNGDSGKIACDHYHRYKEDIALMHELGVQSYRFSIAWSRIFPAQGQYNPKGMEFYKNIISELTKYGISAAITLYHWDLPQWAQDLGGWENRDCASWFVEYAMKCFTELQSLLPQGSMWITLNEPWCSSFLSNAFGAHAPGNTDLALSAKVAHHLLLAHGLTVSEYRKFCVDAKIERPIGIALNDAYAFPKDDSINSKISMLVEDGIRNRWFMDPLFRKCYPNDVLVFIACRTSCDFDYILPGDLDIIGQPIDFIGLNYYNPVRNSYSPNSYYLGIPYSSGKPVTDMGWEIDPLGFMKTLELIRGYTEIPIYITENGSAWKDEVVNQDGKKTVNDQDRIDYLLKHLAVIEEANKKGMKVAGYYCWSFMDNYEWAEGYRKRFGIVYVDYDTLERIPKASFYAYQKYIKEHK